jgi:hypothetical protein
MKLSIATVLVVLLGVAAAAFSETEAIATTTMNTVNSSTTRKLRSWVRVTYAVV